MDITQHILKKLMYNKGMTYNSLREEIASNKFSYHLNKLLEKGIIVKNAEVYELTPDGIHLVSSIDGQDIQEKKRPIVCTFILGSKDGKLLFNKREKQPFMDYVGVPGGKVEFGSLLPEEAQREFLEETGLKAGNMELKYITNYRTYDKETHQLTHHVIGFFFLATKISGELILQTREGTNFWARIDQTTGMKLYPDLIKVCTHLLEGEGILFQEANRYTEKGEFVRIEWL